MQAKKWGEGLEFKIQTMDLLTELKSKKAKSLWLEVESADITDELMENLFTLVSDNKGTCHLKFLIKDYKSNTRVKMPSKTMKVTVENDFIKKIEALNVFEYSLEA